MGLVFAHRVHADDVVKQAVQPGRFDRQLEHGRIAIAQNAGGHTLRLERGQHLFVFGEGAQAAVLVHQPLDGAAVLRIKIDLDLARGPRSACGRRDLFDGKNQGGPGQRPKGLVVRTVVAGGHQSGVLNLLVPPQHAQRLALARKQLLRHQAHAVHIEQRAVGVKQHGARCLEHGRFGFANGGSVDFGHA